MIAPRRARGTPVGRFERPLLGLRIAICGKGGSGKSSLLALMATALRARGYEVLILDGDASNPGGITRLLTGGRIVRPLIEFFGGRSRVTCPVDDPAPLTRINDPQPIAEKNIDLSEIPPEYSVEANGLHILQVGKISEACEGCHGPMSKVTRDFVVKGDWVTLIDLEAGVEHFGRGVEKHVDMVLVVVDPTFESISIAEHVGKMCAETGVRKVWIIVNKVHSTWIRSFLRKELSGKKPEVLGSVGYDPSLLKAGLLGTPLPESSAAKDVRRLIGKLHTALQTDAAPLRRARKEFTSFRRGS